MASAPTLGKRGQTTRTSILEATSQIIADKGIDAFTISEVAKRADVNRALVYHYFKDRDNLISHAIDHMISRYQTAEPDLSAEGVEASARMYIEHPEVARFVFQLFLSNRPLLRLGERLEATIQELERVQRERAPKSEYDAALGLIMLVLAELSWSISREQFADILGVGPDEADERFVRQLRYAAEHGIRSMLSNG